MSYQYGATRTPSAAELDKMRRALATLQQANDDANARAAKLERQLKARTERKAAAKIPHVRQRPTRKLPPPIHGGHVGLLLAARESSDLDKRTLQMIAAGHDSDWIREFKRSRNIKDVAA